VTETLRVHTSDNLPSRSASGEGPDGVYLIGGCMDHRAVPGVLQKRKISCVRRKWKPDPLVIQAVAWSHAPRANLGFKKERSGENIKKK